MHKINSFILFCSVFLVANSSSAGTDVYGQLRYAFDTNGLDEVGGLDSLSGTDSVSLLGVKGSYGEDVNAFFHLQTGAPSDANSGVAFKQRFFFGGFKGKFGKVVYGRMTNLYKLPGFKSDPFYNYSNVNVSGAYKAGGASFGLSGATNGFTDNSLQYTTPSIAGANVTFGYYVDENEVADGESKSPGIAVALNYGNKEIGINGGVAFARNGGSPVIAGLGDNGQALRVYADYKLSDTAKFGLSVEQLNSDTTADEADNDLYAYLTSTVNVPSLNLDIAASMGKVANTDADGKPVDNNGIGGILGLFYNVTDKTKLYLVSSTATKVGKNPVVLSLGAQHKFSLSVN